MKPILTSLAPNLQRDDVARAFFILCMPWTWKRGPWIARLEHEFSRCISARYAIAFESGRSALVALLEAFNIGIGDDVLLQAYTCVAVPNAILRRGARPVYVDCAEDSFTMSLHDCQAKITRNTKALIVQHTFGIPADMDALCEFGKKNNLILIEDCAHGIGATLNGKTIGTFGNAAFWSFGRDKAISSVWGGMVTTNNTECARYIRNLQEKKCYPSYRWILQQLFHFFIASIARRTYTFFSVGKIFMECAKRLSLISKAVTPQERVGEMSCHFFKKFPNALARIAYFQLSKLPQLNAHRLWCAQQYHEALTGTHLLLPSVLPGSNSAPLRFTVRTRHRDNLLRKGKKEQIYFGDWYTRAVAPDGVSYSSIGYDPSLCPRAEQYSAESLNLPTDIHITGSDIQRIVEFLKVYVS